MPSRACSRVDRVLVVDCSEELQIRRLQARDGISLEQARAILDAQVTRDARLSAADDVIVNDGELGPLRDEVARLHARYLSLAGAFRPDAAQNSSRQART